MFDEYCLFFEMGCGKSAALINILRDKYRMTTPPAIVNTLILCPKIILYQWKEEFLTFSRIPSQHIIVLDVPGVKAIKIVTKAIKQDMGIILIINYEKLVTNKKLFDIIRVQFHPGIIVCDESHYLKSPSARRSMLVEELARGAKHRYLLTGTPVLKDALDLFQQFKILDGGETFYPHGTNFYAFRAHYFEDVNADRAGTRGYFPKWMPRAGTEAELNSRIYKKGMRVLKKDCLDLPPLVRQTVEVKMGPEQKRIYGEMKKHFVAYLNDELKEEGDMLVAEQAVVRAMRLQQIITGYCVNENGKTVKIRDNTRIKVLMDVLGQTEGHQVIIWCHFRENNSEICEALSTAGIPAVSIHGGTSQTNRKSALAQFKSGTAQVLVANQRAAGIGVNLTNASYSIYYSKSFSLGDDIQSEARNHRGGSEIFAKITRIDLVARGTIDEVINKALKDKIDMSDRLLEFKNNLLFNV